MSQSFAQLCTPDPTLTKPGLKPSKLPDGIVGTPYSQVATLVVPKDTVIVYTGNTYNVVVDSANVVGMSGLPLNFDYECNKPSKSWAGGERGCARLFGTPATSNIGTYKIYVKVRTYFKIVGLPNQLDQLDSSIIDFNIVSANAIQELNQSNGFSAYPNPCTNILTLKLNNFTSTGIYTIQNLIGESVETKPSISTNTGEITFDVSALKPGVYLIIGENEGTKFQSKFFKN
jgi:hypothetical protein